MGWNLPKPDRMPKCWNSREDWEEWVNAARACGAGRNPRHHGYCIDCLPEFKERMVKCGRCEHPEVFFIERKNQDGDIEIQGQRPAKRPRTEYPIDCQRQMDSCCIGSAS